jgi:hypothetical protein
VKEWVLAPPRAFLFDQVGANGNVYGLNSPEFFSVYLETIVREDGTLVPETTVPKDQRRKRSMVIHITNSGANPGYKLAGGCVPQERFQYALSLVGPSASGEPLHRPGLPVPHHRSDGRLGRGRFGDARPLRQPRAGLRSHAALPEPATPSNATTPNWTI